jgi:uncharacterized damage-inducible protein DinB
MESNVLEPKTATAPSVIAPEAFLDHWQAHRRLTRRVIEAFPEEALFHHSIGGMRPFSAMALELLSIAAPGLRGIVTGEWKPLEEEQAVAEVTTKEELLRRWDADTEAIDRYWAKLPAERFTETVLAFGQYENSVYATLLYFVDNEIHHRAQGYVYLRSLGIEPPAFWDRS